MMNGGRRQRLVEQYEEATVSLLLDELAEADGKRVWREYLESEDRGEIPDVPPELDKKCREILRQSLDDQEQKAHRTHIRKQLCRVAAIVLVFLCAATTLIFSVEALRVPVFNFLLEKYERYTAITNNEKNLEVNANPSDVQSLLDHILPEEYQLYLSDTTAHGSVYLIYQNKQAEMISFRRTPSPGQSVVDTESAATHTVDVNGTPVLFIDKAGMRVVWTDQDEEQFFDFYSESLDQDTFWEIVYCLIATYEKG